MISSANMPEPSTCLSIPGEQQSNLVMQRISFEEKEIILVGMVHMPRYAPDLLDQIMTREKPDTLCIEFCQTRYDALRQGNLWEDTGLISIIRERLSLLLLFQLFIQSIKRNLSEACNVNADIDIVHIVNNAKINLTEIVFAEREIRVSLLRAWHTMRFFSKIKLLFTILLRLFLREHIVEETLTKLRDGDIIELAIGMFIERFPEVKPVLIDERDQYLAVTIRNAPGRKIIALVGAGHLTGVINNMGKNLHILSPLELLPASHWGRVAMSAVAFIAIGFFIIEFLFSAVHASMQMIIGWSSVTAAFAGFGALILLAHPFTIIATTLAAPITSLHPLIASGWVAGLTEAIVRKPTVGSVLHLAEDITGIRSFFSNKIIRLFLLITVVNVTTSIGTFITIPAIMRFF